MTAFFRNTTQYVMDGNIADSPPSSSCRRMRIRDRWYELRKEAAANADGITRHTAGVDDAFEEWLTSGAHRTLETPLEASAELLRLDLDDAAAPAVELGGRSRGGHPPCWCEGRVRSRGPAGGDVRRGVVGGAPVVARRQRHALFDGNVDVPPRGRWRSRVRRGRSVRRRQQRPWLELQDRSPATQFPDDG